MILYDAEVAVVLAVFPPVSAAQEHRKQQNARVWPRRKEGRSSLSGFPNSRVAGKRLGLAVSQKTAGAAKTRLAMLGRRWLTRFPDRSGALDIIALRDCRTNSENTAGASWSRVFFARKTG